MPIAVPALADDAFIQRGTEAVPKRKPSEAWLLRGDRRGRLSASLISAYLFENTASGRSAAIDYISPGHPGLSSTGTIVVTQTPYGGQAVSTSGTSTTDQLFCSIGATGTKWTVSFLAKFDGIGGGTYTGSLVVVANSSVTNGIGVTNATNKFGVFNTSSPPSFATPLVTSLTGWHRLTIGTDNTNCYCYLDGVLSSQVTGAGGAISLNGLVLGWPWPVADLFVWNRMLTATEAAAHFADPYGTTLAPNVTFPLVGSIPRCPAPLPPDPFSSAFNSAFGGSGSSSEVCATEMLMMGVGQ